MNNLDELKSIADLSLGGLQATQGLKYRIIQEAEKPQPHFSIRKWTPALLSCFAVIAMLVVAPQFTASPSEINIQSQALGSSNELRTVSSNDHMNQGSMNIGSVSPVPYASLWAEQQGSTFPIIGFHGQWYRMTTQVLPPELNHGNMLGTVNAFTSEPSLASINTVVSNVAPAGTEVFEVPFMKDAVLAANVNGEMRVFQRVSYAGHALIGTEQLGDTLRANGHVTSIALSDVGVVTDAAVCQQLISVLYTAAYESAGSVSGTQLLLIALDNGLALQMDVRGDRISGCGVWNCPEFFEAFSAALH